MNIKMTTEVEQRLKVIFAKESADAVLRIRESKIGDGWKSKIVLRVSIDEREDDDVEGLFADMPFVIQEELLEQYGEIFSVALDEHQMFTVVAEQQ